LLIVVIINKVILGFFKRPINLEASMAKNQGNLPEVMKVGANELELVIIKMFNKLADGNVETYTYGVNVSKVREIIPMPALTKVPDMPDYAEALAEVRGQVIPVINLGKWLKFNQSDTMEIRPKVVIIDMMGTNVGMIVHEVERIRRIKWDKIKVPPSLLQSKHGGRITGVTKLDDSEDTLLLILDLENIIAEMGAFTSKTELALDDMGKVSGTRLAGTVLIIDDSGVARRILRGNLEKIGLNVMESINGKEAFSVLNDFISKIGDKPITDFVQAVIADVEMPEMDGLTFTKNLKANDKLKSLPVIINTSFGGAESRDRAKLVGADGYLIKNELSHLFDELVRFLKI
jgi:two-component system, chemotaxis family, chemotaxis protein CheV